MRDKQFIIWIVRFISMHAKNEVNGPALTWAHNLFVVWALDFLPWVVPNTETQQSNLSLWTPLLSLLLLFCCFLAPSILSFLWNLSTPFSPLTSHIYSPKLVEELWLLLWWVERRSNVIILKWVFSWEWGVVRVALELVPTLEDLSSSDTLQGNTKHLGITFSGNCFP